MRDVFVRTGTWESLALLLGSVAENTVYTKTKVPIISAPNPTPVLYPSAKVLAPPPYLLQWDLWNAFTNPTPDMAPKHWATMYITARTNETFRARNNPNVTAGLMCPPVQIRKIRQPLLKCANKRIKGKLSFGP